MKDSEPRPPPEALPTFLRDWIKPVLIALASASGIPLASLPAASQSPNHVIPYGLHGNRTSAAFIAIFWRSSTGGVLRCVSSASSRPLVGKDLPHTPDCWRSWQSCLPYQRHQSPAGECSHRCLRGCTRIGYSSFPSIEQRAWQSHEMVSAVPSIR